MDICGLARYSDLRLRRIKAIFDGCIAPREPLSVRPNSSSRPVGPTAKLCSPEGLGYRMEDEPARPGLSWELHRSGTHK
jgi:hypothetical protein